jgi:hypothetical protein
MCGRSISPSARQREAPRVARKQIGLEPDVQPLGSRPGDVPGVLAEGVPLAEVAGLGEAEHLPGRRPHPVGSDDERCADRLTTHDVDHHTVRVEVERSHRMALHDLHTCSRGEVDERCIELDPRRGRRVDALSGREGHADLAAGG